MAYENINILHPNFCLGPQLGTFCSLDNDQLTTIMHIKNAAGGAIADYTLSSNILNDIIGLEYVGPLNLSGILDGLTFFSVEKVDEDTCIIKRWETDTATNSLTLRQQITKTTAGSYYYDVEAMAVEHYHREFDGDTPAGQLYIDVDDADLMANNMTLLLGPSTDLDNPGAMEKVVASSVSGDKVNLNSALTYDYIDGDPVVFYNNIYLTNAKAVGGSTEQGSLFQIQLNPHGSAGTLLDSRSDGLYKGVNGSRWSEYVDAVCLINAMNAVFSRPYDSYQNWRSMWLNNVESDKKTMFPVYDIVFDGATVYKLMQKRNVRDDAGGVITYEWTNYNFQQDTLAPYASNINLYSSDRILLDIFQTTTINIKTIDQFGVGLRDIPIYLEKGAGDPDSEFDPLNGQATSDINGEAIVDYITGGNYQGYTEIKGKGFGSSSSTGSEWIWNSLDIDSELDQDSDLHIYGVSTELSSSARVMRQLHNPFKVQRWYKEIDPESQVVFWTYGYTLPQLYMKCLFAFGTNGGDWTSPSDHHDQAKIFFPELNWTPDKKDGPQEAFDHHWEDGYKFPDGDPGPNTNARPNRITLIEDAEIKLDRGSFRQLLDFKVIDFQGIDEVNEIDPHTLILQRIEEGTMSFSQLKLSKHTHWVDDVAYDYLWTEVNIDQFVFVVDAAPAFWSEKNAIDTDIWIRLRPFASSLDPNTVVFRIQEVSYAGDTGWVDVSDEVVIEPFDAGGGLEGLEITYYPPEPFHYDAIVYVHIEMYDLAGNFISVDYWFRLTPDYRFPYLDNLNPARDETNVEPDTTIYFEIKDQGTGVDIDSLEVYIDSQAVYPQTITRVTDHHYIVEYTPDRPFRYGKAVDVNVKVMDTSPQENRLNDKYQFFIAESAEALLIPLEPFQCRRGLPLFQDVSYLVLGGGNGIDQETIRMQIHGKDVTDHLTYLPVLYRVS